MNWHETDENEDVPVFAEMGLFRDRMDLKIDGIDQAIEAREALWAWREGLDQLDPEASSETGPVA
jgi:hypothetical protein